MEENKIILVIKHYITIHYKHVDEFIESWYNERNRLLYGLSPNQMIESDRADEVLSFIKNGMNT